MSVINALWWWQWTLLALVPVAIVLLYFLKLRRQPLQVPSTYLWSRTIEDLHVNSIWQRLRRNLLLFLQLLLILLVALALLRPGWRGTQMTDDRLIFLIDNSASMSATDQSPNRLDAAKQQAVDLVSQMATGDVAMVISFADGAQVAQTYTESRRLLRRQIQRIQATSRSTSAEEALRAAAGLANPGLTRLEDNQAVDESLPATLYILSDGGFLSVPDFSLGNLNPIYLPVGTPACDNLAIVAFNTDRNPEHPDRLQAFVSVANFGGRAATVLLELFLDGESLDVVQLTVEEESETGWYFELPDLDEGILKIVMSHEDALAVDNIAYTAVNRPRRSRVLLVSPGNEPLRVALQTEQVREIAEVTLATPDVLALESHQTAVAAEDFDVIIYDRCRPTIPPQANTLFIGALPPGDVWNAGPLDGPPAIVDIDQVHPLTQLVDMNYVQIAEGRSLQAPEGSTVLFDSVIGPICAIAPRGGFEDAVLGFTLLDEVDGETVPNTSWPLRRSFPVFVFNAVRYLGGSRGALAVTSVAPGQPVTLRSPAPVRQITVVNPREESQTIERDGQNAFVFTATDWPGVYTVYEGPDRNRVHRFVVNLFDPRESNLAPRSELELGHEAVQGQTTLRATRRELWKWLVLVGLAVLAFEWYVYNRRVYL